MSKKILLSILLVGLMQSADAACNVSASLDFGNYDPTSNVNFNVNGVLTFNGCTQRTRITWYLEPGNSGNCNQRKLCTAGCGAQESLVYNIYRNRSQGLIYCGIDSARSFNLNAGDSREYPLRGRIPPQPQPNVVAGEYTDTIPINVTFDPP